MNQMRTILPVEDMSPGELRHAEQLRAGRLAVWRNVLLEPEYQLGEETFRLATNSTTKRIDPNLSLVQVTMRSENFGFTITLAEAFLLDCLEGISTLTSISGQTGPDAALILEQFFRTPLEEFSNLLGEYPEIVRIAPAEIATLGRDDFQFTISGDQGGGSMCFIRFDGALEDRVFERLGAYSSADEKEVEPQLEVRIGPISLPQTAIANLRAGVILDCGVQPTDTIRGLLVRSDNRYWPAHINDGEVVATAAIQPLDYSNARHSGLALITLGFGSALMGPLERLQFGEGDTIAIERYSDNAVEIYANEHQIGKGQLVVHDDNLSVSIEQVDLV